MLARLHTEDELVALLCHEANHFICNHYLENMAKIQKREKAGIISSVILGTTLGVLSGSASIGLDATSATLGIANSLNQLITDMGLEFNQTQEKESDEAAVELLPILGYDENAMATTINAIGKYYLEEGDLDSYYKSGRHPKIKDRIAATGIPYERTDTTFERLMAPCVSFSANTAYSKGRYIEALNFLNQNTRNKAARAIDYYMKGECLLACYDSEESNTEAKDALLKAKETYVDDTRIIKALVVANLRLGNKEGAKQFLDELKGLSHTTDEDKIWAQNMLLNL